MQRNITLVNDLKKGCNAVLKVDRHRFREVLLNLLGNAIKYNREGGSVTVQCEQLSERRFRVSVHDTGRGIAREKQSLLFEPFQRLGMEFSDVEGTGFGLMISKRLIQLMGGEIGVVSEEGEGTTFWVDCPGFVDKKRNSA